MPCYPFWRLLNYVSILIIIKSTLPPFLMAGGEHKPTALAFTGPTGGCCGHDALSLSWCTKFHSPRRLSMMGPNHFSPFPIKFFSSYCRKKGGGGVRDVSPAGTDDSKHDPSELIMSPYIPWDLMSSIHKTYSRTSKSLVFITRKCILLTTSDLADPEPRKTTAA